MTPSKLDRAIAVATGESVWTIIRLGFSLANPLDPPFDSEAAGVATFLDWDDVAWRRYQQLGVH